VAIGLQQVVQGYIPVFLVCQKSNMA